MTNHMDAERAARTDQEVLRDRQLAAAASQCADEMTHKAFAIFYAALSMMTDIQSDAVVHFENLNERQEFIKAVHNKLEIDMKLYEMEKN